MFQLYRDGLDDLLKETKKPKQGEEEKKPPPLKITLAEHSPTGLVIVSFILCIFIDFCCESVCRTSCVWTEAAVAPPLMLHLEPPLSHSNLQTDT